MAWYAELKRRRWYCINGMDMVAWYSGKLYDEWYASLTDEQRELLEERRKARQEADKRKAREALSRLLMIGALTEQLAENTGYSFQDKSSEKVLRELKDSLE